MAQYTAHRRALSCLTATAALALAACGGGNDAAKSANAGAPLATDTALARDLSLANQQPAPQPQLSDVPATTPAPATAAPAPVPREEPRSAPARREPAPRREPRNTGSAAPRRSNPNTTANAGSSPAPAPANNAERGGVGTVPAGATLLLSSNKRICTNNSSTGDRFTASLVDAVSGSNGASFPAGATADVEVTDVSGSGSANDPIKLGFRVVSISSGGRTYAVSATTESADVSRVKNAGASKDPQKVIGGAVAGGILGRIIGGGAKGTIIGAAAGAAAGAGVAKATERVEGCLNDGASLRARLNDGVQIRL